MASIPISRTKVLPWITSITSALTVGSWSLKLSETAMAPMIATIATSVMTGAFDILPMNLDVIAEG